MSYDNIPAELRALRQWVCWRNVVKVEGKKPTKQPFNPLTNKHASSMDFSTWTTFDIAVQHAGRFDGIGFVFTPESGIVGIDLDKPGDDALHDDILARIPGYAEYSPSGNGLHILTLGTLPSTEGTRNSAFNVEMYNFGRFFTVTGNVLPGRESLAYADPAALHGLYEHIKGRSAIPANLHIDAGSERRTDDAIIEAFMTSPKQAEKFSKLWAGRWQEVPEYAQKSQSDADFGFCGMLTFYTSSVQQVKRIFCKSGLWNETRMAQKGDDYPLRTANNAVQRELGPVLDFVNGNFRAEIERQMQQAVDIEQAIATRKAEGEARRLQALAEAREKRSSALAEKIYSNADALWNEIYKLGPPLTSPEDELTPPPGLVGDLARYMYGQATRPHGTLAAVAALALTAGICGRAYNVERNGIGLYMVYIADTGAGKESMADGIDAVVNSVENKHPAIRLKMGPGAFSSGQALYRQLQHQPCMFTLWGEMWQDMQRLADVNGRAPDAVKLLRKGLLEAYTKSGHNKTMAGTAYAKKEDDLKAVKSPSLTLLGESSPPMFYKALSEEMLMDGFLPRFLILQGNRKPANPSPQMAVPRTITERLTELVKDADKIDSQNTVIYVQRTPEAAELLKAYEDGAELLCDGGVGDEYRELWTRAFVHVIRVAGVVAVGVSHSAPLITAEIATWAMSVVNTSIYTIVKKYRDGEIGTGESKAIADIRRKLMMYAETEHWQALPVSGAVDPSAHALGIVSYNWLSKAVGATAALTQGAGGLQATRARCLRHLIDEGFIVPLTPEQAGGRPGIYYRINYRKE